MIRENEFTTPLPTPLRTPIKETLVPLRTNLNGNGSVRWRPSVFLDLFHWPLGKNVCNCNGVCRYVRGLPKLISFICFIIKVHLMLVNPVVYSYATRKPRQRQYQRAGSRLWSMVAIALCTGNPAQPSHSIMGSNFFLKQHHRFSYNYYFQGSNFQFSSFCSCMFYLVSS